jgi:protein pelota
MRLHKKNIDRGSGVLKLEPEEQEDMWHAYNLIAVGDSLRASTVRKVVQTSDTGSSTTTKKRMDLTIEVLGVDYDSSACALRVKGRTIVENDFVKKGSYHTLDLELHSVFSLRKHEWDSIALDRVEMACNPVHQADVAAIVMHEGLANVCLITEHLTIHRQKIEHTIPRKRKNLCSHHDKSMEKFFDAIIAAMIKHIDFSVVKAVILASPGFIKDQFYQYMLQKATRDDQRHLLENKNKFILSHSSNGFKHALTEVLQDPIVLNRLSDTKAAGEMKLFEQFMQLLNDEPDKAYYGLEAVEKANQSQAIECLLITDELFRNIDFVKRHRYIELVDSVKYSGGEVRLFSSMHASGERLGQLTGIAAILRFPMPDLDLSEEHHHTNSELKEFDHDELPPNPNRTVNHIDNTDENRAEASAW